MSSYFTFKMYAKKLILGASALIAFAPAAVMAEALPPVIISKPVAELPEALSAGLCNASAISDEITKDFAPLNKSNYVAGMNTFIDDHVVDRVETVVRTLLDLSNNNDTGAANKPSYGDFIDAMIPTCKTGGCDFFINDTTTSFGSRLRGFFRVAEEDVGQPLHFGIYADEAVSLAFFDKTAKMFPVVIRPPQLGYPAWRTTNSVTFVEAGLYPVEILYIEIGEHAALEISVLKGNFTDFEAPRTVVGSPNLKDAGFTLLEPTAFVHTLSGQPSFPDLTHCQQCNRQFVNTPGNAGCQAGYMCNEAALCAPCDTAMFCGPTCAPCGGDTPVCGNINGETQCVQCQSDADCASGSACDPATLQCEPGDGAGAGAGGAGGAGAGGTGAGADDDPGDGDGFSCSCRTVQSTPTKVAPFAALFGLAAALGLRRRRGQALN